MNRIILLILLGFFISVGGLLIQQDSNASEIVLPDTNNYKKLIEALNSPDSGIRAYAAEALKEKRDKAAFYISTNTKSSDNVAYNGEEVSEILEVLLEQLKMVA